MYHHPLPPTEMLTALSGSIHNVVTGVALIYAGASADGGSTFEPPHMNVFHDVTIIEFMELSQKQIAEYVATGEPLDKAGAYGIQASDTCSHFESPIRHTPLFSQRKSHTAMIRPI